jgi:hypothetical protein
MVKPDHGKETEGGEGYLGGRADGQA